MITECESGILTPSKFYIVNERQLAIGSIVPKQTEELRPRPQYTGEILQRNNHRPCQICVREKLGQRIHVVIVTSSLSKAPFSKCFPFVTSTSLLQALGNALGTSERNNEVLKLPDYREASLKQTTLARKAGAFSNSSALNRFKKKKNFV